MQPNHLYEYDDAFVTSLVPYGESDGIVRLFFKQKGRLTAFMKGGLRPSKRRPGLVQAPCLALATFIKAPPPKMTKLYALDAKTVCEGFSSSLKSFAYVNYVAELIETFLPEEDPAPELFALLEELLHLLACLDPAPILLRAFELKLLAYAGYLPDLFLEEHISPLSICGYDPRTCQFLTEPLEGMLKFDGQALEIAQTLVFSPLPSLPQVDLDVLRTVGRIFLGRLWLMGKLPLKSATFFKSIGV